jgi:phosphotriesterase-related protein
MISRRKFIKSCIAAPLVIQNPILKSAQVNTVTGKIDANSLGATLIHEHILVDFIGADKIKPDRWKHEDVIAKVLPYLLEIKSRGITSFMECTPAFLGRDVVLLKKLSELSGLKIITNTGYYGASDNKFLPKQAFQETAEELSERWIGEFANGIDGTLIKPGFIKIGVNPGPLSDLHKKLVKAAALTHLKTGLTICSHTGPALPAFEELAILKLNGVAPDAFVWVHANGTDADFVKIGKTGAWISLDGISNESLAKNADTIRMLKSNGLLNRVLISHDAGWYRPGELNGGEFRGYTTIPDKFLPLLKSQNITTAEIKQLLVGNPAQAFGIKIRKA